jgi:hypothetical protein
MPSHSASSAFTLLWVDCKGAPWNFPTWRQITGLGDGLLSDEDSTLPKGWSRQTAHDVLYYFDQYKSIDNETERLKFAQQTRGKVLPGQRSWREFITKGCAKWNLHGRIVEGLRAHNIHPLTLMISENNLDNWPSGELFIPEALETIGISLFGPEALDASTERLPLSLRNGLRMLVQVSWGNLRRQIQKNTGKLQSLELAAITAMEGKLCLFIFLFRC